MATKIVGIKKAVGDANRTSRVWAIVLDTRGAEWKVSATEYISNESWARWPEGVCEIMRGDYGRGERAAIQKVATICERIAALKADGYSLLDAAGAATLK